MNRSTSFSIVAIAAALIAAPAMANDNSAKTRAQVKAELSEAVRTGNVIVGTSSKLNQMFPDLYEQKTAAAGKTRAQVLAELSDAVRSGDVIVGTSTKLNQMFPDLYAQKTATNTAATSNGVIAN